MAFVRTNRNGRNSDPTIYMPIDQNLFKTYDKSDRLPRRINSFLQNNKFSRMAIFYVSLSLLLIAPETPCVQAHSSFDDKTR